jgi:transcription initiation factor TFIIIB Brf1 subunit/transcription initiation factor TFIIB
MDQHLKLAGKILENLKRNKEKINAPSNSRVLASTEILAIKECANNTQLKCDPREDPKKSKSAHYCCSCGSDSLYYDSDFGANICTVCGVSNGSIVDTSEIWLQNHEGVFHKKLENYQRCINGKPTPSVAKFRMSGIGMTSKIHNWSNYTHQERTLNNVYSKIHTQLEPIVQDKSVLNKIYNIYSTAYTTSVFRGTGLLGACALYASMSCGVLVDTSAIAEAIGTTEKNVRKNLNRLVTLFEKNGEAEQSELSGKSFVDSLSIKMEMDQKHTDIAQKIMNNSDQIHFRSNRKTIASGIIYLVSDLYGLKYTKKDIAEKCGVSEVTIYKSYSTLLTHKEILLNGIDTSDQESTK